MGNVGQVLATACCSECLFQLLVLQLGLSHLLVSCKQDEEICLF
jgi:hypothetical protein